MRSPVIKESIGLYSKRLSDTFLIERIQNQMDIDRATIANTANSAGKRRCRNNIIMNRRAEYSTAVRIAVQLPLIRIMVILIGYKCIAIG